MFVLNIDIFDKDFVLINYHRVVFVCFFSFLLEVLLLAIKTDDYHDIGKAYGNAYGYI